MIFICCFSFILISCASGPVYQEVRFHKFPKKVAYIKGQDMNLTLDGCEVIMITKNGSRSIYDLKEEFESYYIVKEDIDFNVPGVYIVKHEFQFGNVILCDFSIEVIDPAILSQ